MKRIFPLVFGLLGVVLVASSSLAQSAGFVELFQGAPAAPEPYKNPHNWDIFVQGFNDREPSLAQHGPNCEPPGFPYAAGNTHPMHSAADAVFLCANHVMTSPGIAGYAAIYMTPPAVMDFSGGSSTLRWNMSTLRTAARDWVDVVITPWQERSNLAYNNNDQHIPPDNIHISLAGTNVFLVTQRTGGSLTYQGTSEDTLLAGDGSTTWDQVFARAGLSESPARRDTFEVVLTQTTISLCMPGYQTGNGGVFCWVNTQLPHALDPAVWNGHASVMFGDRTYNAEKSCTAAEDQFNIVHNPQGDAECPPDTWHWSDVSITPALSATIIPSVPQDFTTSSTDPTVVSFASPAPAGSSLSFTTFSHTPDLRVSFDGGRSWQAPRIQPANAPNNGASEENGEQVWTSVPAGTQQIMVRGSNGFWGGFEAEAFTLNAPPDGIPQRTPVPTATLLPATPTPAAPTDTPVPLPTAVPATLTPAPTVAATMAPTVAPTVEPSATLTPSACVAVSVDVTINGVPQERAEYCQ